MARLNIFENFPIFYNIMTNTLGGDGSLMIHHVYFPGSISFNNVVMGMSVTGTGSKTLSVSLGLYSLNGATLSLANSAGFTDSRTTSVGISWMTLATSATQDIFGEWFFAAVSQSAGTGLYRLVVNTLATTNANQFGGGYGGPF